MVLKSKDCFEKAKRIKAILFDIDGVLTDGGIIYDDRGVEYKRFNVKDGQIVSHLRRLGFVVGAITGRDSAVVRSRCSELGLDFHKHGIEDKLTQYQIFKKEYSLTDDQVAYIGDDIIDLSILSRCGLGATPKDARDYMKDSVDMVTYSRGGEGVFRDVADYILEAQGLLKDIIMRSKKEDNYGQRRVI